MAAEDEVPAYATDNAPVKFKEGVQVPANPMTKLYKVSTTPNLILQKTVDEFVVVKPESAAKTIDKSQLTLECLDKDGSKTYMVVMRSATMKPLYTGTLNKNSKIKRVAEQAEKH